MIIKNNIINEIKLLIFDIDGTLLEYRTLKELVKKGFEKLNINYEDDFFKAHCKAVQTTLEKCAESKSFNMKEMCLAWEEFLPFIKKNNIDAKTYAEIMLDLEKEYTYIIENVIQTLEVLKKKYNIVISTNWFLESQKRKLNKFDLLKYFEHIYTCENNYAKPSKKHFEMIKNDYRCNPNECIIIGDTFSDVVASAYGYNSVLCDYRLNKNDIYEISTCVISDFKDLTKILKK